MTDLDAKVFAIVAASQVLEGPARTQYVIDNLTDVVRAEKAAAWGEGATAQAEYQRLYQLWVNAGMIGERPTPARSPYSVVMPDEVASETQRCPDCRMPFGFHGQTCTSHAATNRIP